MPSAAAADTTGWLRLAHLSPDTPDVDVYLQPFGGGAKPVVLRSVGYGDVSAYRSVPAGTYTAVMRWAGQAGSSTPILKATARVAADRAYTVAAVGRRDDLSTKLLDDDLTPPPAGKGRIRLIQASTRADAVTVQATGGPLLAEGTPFGTATGYVTVPAGRWTLQVTPVGGTAKPLTTVVDVPAGRVSSVLVLDGKATDSLALKATVDSEGSSTMPQGGVKTGHGPTTADATSSRLATGPVPVAAVALLALATVGIVRARGTATARTARVSILARPGTPEPGRAERSR